MKFFVSPSARLAAFFLILIQLLAFPNKIHAISACYHYDFRFLPHYIVTSEATASVQALTLPVFDANPYDAVTCGVVIAPDGNIVELINNGELEDDFFADGLKNSAFIPAMEGGKPAWSYERRRADAYFHLTGGDFSALPTCRFQLSEATLLSCFPIADAVSKESKDSPIRLIFSIDETGRLTAIKATDKRSDAVLTKVFKPIEKTLVFSPAKSKGVPSPAELTLVLERRKIARYCRYVYKDPQETLGELPSPYSGVETITVKGYVTYDENGEVETIRLPGTLDRSAAIPIIRILSRETSSVSFDPNAPLKVAGYQLSLTPGSKNIGIVQGPYIVPIKYPMMPDIGKMPWRNLPLERLLRADLSWIVETDGNVTGRRIDNAEPSAFRNRLNSLLNSMEMADGSFDGNACEFLVFARLDYVITGGTWIFD
jgi:hypothetical protein